MPDAHDLHTEVLSCACAPCSLSTDISGGPNDGNAHLLWLWGVWVGGECPTIAARRQRRRPALRVGAANPCCVINAGIGS